MIVGRIILINQDYYFLTEILVDKVGQIVQAQLQINLRTGLVTNRFKIGPFRELQRHHEKIFPRLIESGNEGAETLKHLHPRPAGDNLLGVNELTENLERIYTNFEVAGNNGISSHVIPADIRLGRDI